MDAMEDYYRKFNANVHRGSYQLANEATAILEGARDNVENSLTQIQRKKLCSATEAMNLVSNTWGRENLASMMRLF